jgi:hypothetical protein
VNHHCRRSALIRNLVAVAAAAVVAAGCGSDAKSSDATSAAASSSIGITSVWARTSPMVADAGAVYLAITNSGAADDALVGVKVDASVAMSAQMHETVPATNTMPSATTMPGAEPMMVMQPVDRIVVPAGGSVALAPGGYHIMLMDLATPLVAGDKVDLTLTFEKSGDKVVTADVRDTAP